MELLIFFAILSLSNCFSAFGSGCSGGLGNCLRKARREAHRRLRRQDSGSDSGLESGPQPVSEPLEELRQVRISEVQSKLKKRLQGWEPAYTTPSSLMVRREDRGAVYAIPIKPIARGQAGASQPSTSYAAVRPARIMEPRPQRSEVVYAELDFSDQPQETGNTHAEIHSLPRQQAFGYQAASVYNSEKEATGEARGDSEHLRRPQAVEQPQGVEQSLYESLWEQLGGNPHQKGQELRREVQAGELDAAPPLPPKRKPSSAPKQN